MFPILLEYFKVHALTEDKNDDKKDSFHKEPDCAFDQFPKYNMKILLWDFNEKVGWENTFKSTITTRFYIKLLIIME